MSNQLIYTGKAKDIYSTEDENVIKSVYKDQATMLNGARKETIKGPVAGGLVEVHGADAGSHDVQVAACTLFLLDIVLQLLPDGVACGQEHGQAAAHQVVGHKQAHLLADLAVIALTGLLLLFLPGVQLFLVVECHAVDAGQHLVLFVVLPVRAGLLGDLKGFQGLGVGQVQIKPLLS